MTRQTLINEIQKLYVEKKESKGEIANDVFVFQKYPYLKGLFEEYKLRGERWHQLVREVLFFDSESIRYMYERTMQIIRRIGQDTKMYFELKTELGTYIIPDRLSDLNKLLELYEVFFCEILPRLTKRINLDMLSEEHKGRVVAGRIHWARTINDPCNLGLENPLVFTITRPTTRFDIPENILLVLSILRMKYDAVFFLGYDFSDPLSPIEREILMKIIEGCNRGLRLTLLHELIPQAKRFVLLKLDDPRVRSLESKVYSRIREYSPRNELFRELLKWRRMYRDLQLRISSPYTTPFTLDHIYNVDKMYELWVLFEFLDFLIDEGSNVTINRFPRKFSISTNKKRYTLFYEKYYEGWSSFGALPDLTIEVAGDVKIVMDAKNWLVQDKKEAVYKMLGYMNNLDTPLGILFFPNENKLKKERIHCGKGLKYHKKQCLFNCVLYPSGSPEGHNDKIKRFSDLLSLILENID